MMSSLTPSGLTSLLPHLDEYMLPIAREVLLWNVMTV